MGKPCSAVEICPALDPPLKWAGGKRWLVPELIAHYSAHRHRRLVEPFVGGLAVSLGLLPREALLSDINEHAINFYQWLQRGLKITFATRNEKQSFYRNRVRFNDLVRRGETQSAQAAGLFYYLNRTCFNGLCRFNNQGFFNVPFGRYAKINYKRDCSEYAELLSSWTFSAGDFQELKIRRSDFIYADPPYDVEFTKYSKNDFTWDDQLRLAKWLSIHRGPVVASNQATPRILRLYRKHGFAIRLLSAPRMISCTGDRSRAQEMLATRNI